MRRSRAARGAAVDDPVAVVGAGPIGLLVLAALRREGYSDVVVAEPSEHRAALAATFGAAKVVDDVARIGASIGDAPAIVFDCAGVAATLPVALGQVRGGGQLVLVGATNPGDVYALPGLLWLIKEVDIISALGYATHEFAESVDAIAGGAVDVTSLVSEVRPLEATADAFVALTSPGGPAKILLDPGRD